MNHIQDLGRFDNKMLKDFQRQAVILCDRKLWRKCADELERRRRTLHAVDGGNDLPKTLICGHCAHHRKGSIGDGVMCGCGGRSWLICTLGCLDEPAEPLTQDR